MKIKTTNKGFTLIEIIVVMVIIGIIGVFGSLFLIDMIKSYQWAEDNAHLTQKAQVALTRIAVEVAYAEGVDVDNENNVLEIHNDETILIVQKDNNKLQIGGYTLTDLISEFEVDENEGVINIILTMIGANDAPQEFEQTMAVP